MINPTSTDDVTNAMTNVTNAMTNVNHTTTTVAVQSAMAMPSHTRRWATVTEP